MGFDVPADAYGAFMGRFSEPLAARFAELIAVVSGTALDVGAGTGALTAQLVAALDVDRVTAVEPSRPFAAALRARFPGMTVVEDGAESMPFRDGAFDLVAAQLVVHLVDDAGSLLSEMVRVTAPGGRVAAAVWDFAGDRAPVSEFWTAARRVDPAVEGERGLAGAAEGDLESLLLAAGLRDVTSTALEVTSRFPDAAARWAPFTLGVGPAGACLRSLPSERLEAVQHEFLAHVPDGPHEVSATAWAAIGTR